MHAQSPRHQLLKRSNAARIFEQKAQLKPQATMATMDIHGKFCSLGWHLQAFLQAVQNQCPLDLQGVPPAPSGVLFHVMQHFCGLVYHCFLGFLTRESTVHAILASARKESNAPISPGLDSTAGPAFSIVHHRSLLYCKM